jgi:hypothetical protein
MGNTVNFVVYSMETGNVLRKGTCPQEFLEMQAGAGEGVIESSVGFECRIINGVPVVKDESELIAEVRAELEEGLRLQRNLILKNTDWTQVEDAPVDRAAWAAYRQALRDLPEQEGFPESVVWPEIPNEVIASSA